MERVHLRILPRTPVLHVKVKPRVPLTLHLKPGHSIDWYNGAYEVTPKRVDQVLPTKDKTMRENVTVFEIPYYKTANQYGNTYVIGE